MTDLIRDLPIDDRPRERLFEHGADTLSPSELLAILIGSGTRGVNAMQLARQVLKNGVNQLANLDVAQLAQVRGIGPAKAARIAAAFALARRGEKEDYKPFQLADFAKKLVATHAHHKQERLGAAIIDGANQIRRQAEIFVGTVRYTVVSPREIIQFALAHDATALVLYHNHPSGKTNPSYEDVTFTKKVAGALELCDIELIDHIIVGGKTYTAMKNSYF